MRIQVKPSIAPCVVALAWALPWAQLKQKFSIPRTFCNFGADSHFLLR